jgi:hypothetical protein
MLRSDAFRLDNKHIVAKLGIVVLQTKLLDNNMTAAYKETDGKH